MPRDQAAGGTYDDSGCYFYFGGRFAAMPKFFVQLPGKPATSLRSPALPPGIDRLAKKKIVFFSWQAVSGTPQASGNVRFRKGFYGFRETVQRTRSGSCTAAMKPGEYLFSQGFPMLHAVFPYCRTVCAFPQASGNIRFRKDF